MSKFPKVCVLLFVVAASSLRAEVTLHRLFTDNGILQQGAKVPVWGTSDKTDPVTVKFAGQHVTATPRDGKWQAELAAMKANATPGDLIVTQGNQTLTRTNIVVGEVWLCGGQSNMKWPVKLVDGWQTTIPASTNPQLRLFTVGHRSLPEPATELTNGNWVAAVPETVAEFSAVGYYFGRDLQRNLQVPVGLIDCSVNGTMAEQWLSPRVIGENPAIKDMSAPNGKGGLYNGMLAPLSPFAIKGVIWYQGEGNAHRPYIYRHVLAALVRNWRDTFGQGDFPFFIVELPPFLAVNDPDLEWAVVRESQQWVAENLPHVETISTIDLGDAYNLHPQPKQPIGARLAIAARATVYGEKITPTGPRYDRAEFRGSQAVLHFQNVDGGLELGSCIGSNTSPSGVIPEILVTERAGIAGGLKGFTIAGADRQFHPAQARIEGDTVIVTADAVPQPVAVRFGWTNYPVANLWNKADLPAHPFRTDDWKVPPQDVK